MDFSWAAKLRYRNKGDFSKLKQQMKERLHYEPHVLHPETAHIFYSVLNTDPCSYWNDDIRQLTLNKLEEIYADSHSSVKFDYDILEHFFIGYHTYRQSTHIINELSDLNDNQLIKNRMYRIPTYISILEGCLTNLFRVIILFLNFVSVEDYSLQKKLGNICNVLNANGLEALTAKLDIDVRNAINHGGVAMLEDGKAMEFQFTKQKRIMTKKLSLYEFDDLINNTYDVASGVLLAMCQFMNDHIKILSVDRNENSYVSFNLLSMGLSIPCIECTNISDIPENKQVNINLYVENTERTFLVETAFEIALQVYRIYPQYEQYLIQFDNERLMMAWVRFKGQEISDIINRKQEMGDILKIVIERGDANISDVSNEIIDMQEVKFFRFPNYKDNSIKINNVEDASMDGRKRLKAHLFIGDITDKNEILDAINKAIDWVKILKNPPSPKTIVKHGTMEADSVYLNVYKHDYRRDKNVFTNNLNFICKVDYNIDGKMSLKHGGVFEKLWNSYHHETRDKMLISWRSKEYKPPKIGVNEPCPCGSGKKYKKCCGQ